MRGSCVLAALCLTFTCSVSLSQATDITIWDKNSTDADWHKAGEDQEVEPGMSHGQEWDLEAFVLDGNSLSVIGGYDFMNGVSAVGQTWTAGDIFIDVDGDSVYGDIDGGLNENQDVINNYGYDFVLDVDMTNFKYNVYLISETSIVSTAHYYANEGSSPWQYVSGGSILFENLSFSYTTGLSDDEVTALAGNGVSFAGDMSGVPSHNMMSGFDLSFLGYGKNFTVHTTMECGNDNLMGAGVTPVPEPTTAALIGVGLLGVVGIRRKSR